MNKLRTTIEINTGGCDDYSVPVEIEFSVYPGCAATSVSPAEESTASFDRITVIESDGTRQNADWLIGILESDEELLNLCLLDWSESQIDAAEHRAESIREDRQLTRKDQVNG